MSGAKVSAHKSLGVDRRVALQDQSKKKRPPKAKPEKFAKYKSSFSQRLGCNCGENKVER
jgi:hypothetical protein